MTENLSVDIRLSLQRALIGNISEHVRGICCDWNDNHEWFRIIFYLDVEPNNEERELQSIVMTEFHCDLPEFKKFYEECVFNDKPLTESDTLRLIIFWRNEDPVFNDRL